MRLLLILFVCAMTANAADYVVVLNDDANPDTVARFHGVGPKHKWTKALKGFSGRLSASQFAKLEKDSRVQFIEPDVTVTNCAQTTPPGIIRIGCSSNALWSTSNVTPIDVDIAIIDTGIDLTHTDLNVFANTTFVTGTTTGNDDHGHGTHVAGIAAAKNNSFGVVGVAPGARLWAVKVLDSAGSGVLSQIISGVDYVTQHADAIEVANLSLGGEGSSESLRQAIQACVAAGVVVVVAAGNSAFDIYGADQILGTSDDFFPASYPEAMTVSASIDTDGIAGGLGSSTGYGLDDAQASFSNFANAVDATNPVSSSGGAIDVAAPGVNIYSTYKAGAYATMSGTSMACPHVSGAVGLYIDQFGRATTASGVYAIRQAIIDASEPQTAWGKNVTNPNLYEHYPEGLARTDLAAAPSTNTYPIVVISAPPHYDSSTATTTYATTDSITFTATAVDDVDGDLSASLIWTSSLQGAIGTGATFSRTLTTVGTHAIKCYCTSSRGLIGSDSCRIGIRSPVVNAYPVITISSPTTGTTNSSPVTFVGTATDAEDGTLTSSMWWTSSVDGQIGTGGTCVASLTPGAHQIIGWAKDSGLKNGYSYIDIVVSGTAPPATNYPPVVTISQPANGITVQQGTTVVVAGSASDTEDGSLSSSIVLSDNLAGSLGTGASQSYVPAVGSHTVTASVADSDGATASASRSFTVVATPAPSVALVVTVTANKASYINKEKALISATVTANGNPVSGATVNFSIRTATGRVITKSGVLSGSTGVASYQQAINKSQFGTGTATVTANASKTSYVSGQGTTTFSVR